MGDIYTSNTFDELQINDSDKIAGNINLILNIVLSFKEHDVMVLDKCISYCYLLVNICRIHSFEVSLYSHNSRTYEYLRDLGYSAADLSRDRNKYFTTLESRDVEELIFELIPILKFIIEYKKGICNHAVLGQVFSYYKIRDMRDLQWALNDFFRNQFGYGKNTSSEIVIDSLDNELVNKIVKHNRNSSKYIINLLKQLTIVCNRSIKFKFNLKFSRFSLCFPEIYI